MSDAADITWKKSSLHTCVSKATTALTHNLTSSASTRATTLGNRSTRRTASPVRHRQRASHPKLDHQEAGVGPGPLGPKTGRASAGVNCKAEEDGLAGVVEELTNRLKDVVSRASAAVTCRVRGSAKTSAAVKPWSTSAVPNLAAATPAASSAHCAATFTASFSPPPRGAAEAVECRGGVSPKALRLLGATGRASTARSSRRVARREGCAR